MGAAAFAVGVAVGAVILTSRLTAGRGVELAGVTVLGGWSFIAAGLVARQRQPGNRVGVLMVTTGFAWMLGGLRWADGNTAAATVGALGGWLWGALLAHLLLAFPSGRLPGRLDRGLAAAAYLIATVGRWAWIVLADESVVLADLPNAVPRSCLTCPTPVLSLALDPDAARVLSGAENAAAAVVALAICGRLVWRWGHGPPPQRRALTPVVVAGAAITVVVAASTGIAALGLRDFGRALSWLWDACVVLLPFAFLGGMLRTRLDRATGLAWLVDELAELRGSERLPALLARALGDDSLAVVYWLAGPGHYVDSAGRVVALPDPCAGRAVTLVELDGRPVAALVHDPSLSEEAPVVRTAGRTAALWLERGRLEAERNAIIVELRESRARIVAAGDAERRRIERDLHDGAQQRLAALLLQTKLRRRTLAAAFDTEALLEEVEHGLVDALAELRALAAGILPPVLSDHGLPAAVEELAARTPVVLAVNAAGVGRLPSGVETAGYFVISEAVANVIKHAHAQRVDARIARHNGMVVIEVTDDGIGGASLDGGTGLRGLADRVRALDGALTCSSPPSGGTVVRAEIPCGP